MGDLTKLVVGLVWHYAATVRHKCWVAYYLLCYTLTSAGPGERLELLRRAVVHDLSKFRLDEAQGFAVTISRLRNTEYGTDEYRRLLRLIRPSIARHYERNSHHPEFHTPEPELLVGEFDPHTGFERMGWLDRIEMVADWSAAVRRHADGDLAQSIETNQDRFGYDTVEKMRLVQIAERMGSL